MRYLLLCLCLISLTLADPNTPVFSDSKWQNDVKTISPDLLYAPHYKDGKFFNPWMPMEQGGLARFLSWKLSARNTYTAEEKNAMPEIVSGLKSRIDELPADADFIAWIGHTTFLIRTGGEYWLTDPMFSDRALLPKRRTAAGPFPFGDECAEGKAEHRHFAQSLRSFRQGQPCSLTG